MNFIWSSFLNGKLIKRWNEEERRRGGGRSFPWKRASFYILEKVSTSETQLFSSHTLLVVYLECKYMIYHFITSLRKTGWGGRKTSLMKTKPHNFQDRSNFCQRCSSFFVAQGKKIVYFIIYMRGCGGKNRAEGNCAKTILIRSAKVGCNFFLPLCYQSTKCVDWFYWV